MENESVLSSQYPSSAEPNRKSSLQPNRDPGKSFLKRLNIFSLLEHIRRICNSHKKDLRTLNKRISRLLEAHEKNERELQSHLAIVADCQKETARCANHELERHALYPAVEAVFMLTCLFQELGKQWDELITSQEHCPLMGSLVNSIAEAAKLANDKCEYLGIQAICPRELDDFDPKQHDIKQVGPTDDSAKHKKIERTLVPGLTYRGKVLQPAKVSVYRYRENQ